MPPPGKTNTCARATNTWTQQSTGTSTFLQLGTGAVVRTVTSKLQDVVHVKDFGAKGDGVTDDSAAFTAALASGAGEVRADDGIYVVNEHDHSGQGPEDLLRGRDSYRGRHPVYGLSHRPDGYRQDRMRRLGSDHLDAEERREYGMSFRRRISRR